MGDLQQPSANGLSLLEQHIGTILQVLIAGSLFWIGSTAVELRTQVSQLQVKVDYLGQRASTLDQLLVKRDETDWNRKDQDAFERGLRERLNNIDARLSTNSAIIEEMRRKLR